MTEVPKSPTKKKKKTRGLKSFPIIVKDKALLCVNFILFHVWAILNTDGTLVRIFLLLLVVGLWLLLFLAKDYISEVIFLIQKQIIHLYTSRLLKKSIIIKSCISSAMHGEYSFCCFCAYKIAQYCIIINLNVWFL